jgi:hypothetical protein
MTEADWHCCPYPKAMLAFLRGHVTASQRKLLLFAAACVRRVWPSLPAVRSREAVEVLEQFVDGQCSVDEFAAIDLPRFVLTESEASTAIDDPVSAAGIALQCALCSPPMEPGASHDASPAKCAAATATYAAFACLPPRGSDDWGARCAAEEAAQAALLRDIFGPLPFRRVAVPLPCFAGTTAVP